MKVSLLPNRDFLKALVQFPKPIIAGVNGNAMGLGVTMLPLFDMVIANDKAEFYLPYAKLGQVPEGGATYTFPNLCGKLQVCSLEELIVLYSKTLVCLTHLTRLLYK